MSYRPGTTGGFSIKPGARQLQSRHDNATSRGKNTAIASRPFGCWCNGRLCLAAPPLYFCKVPISYVCLLTQLIAATHYCRVFLSCDDRDRNVPEISKALDVSVSIDS
jgi:hypothetical protein